LRAASSTTSAVACIALDPCCDGDTDDTPTGLPTQTSSPTTRTVALATKTEAALARKCEAARVEALLALFQLVTLE
jgi:hypothetical protein